MTEHVEHTLRNCRPVLGARIAASANPVANEAIRRHGGRVQGIEDFDRGLQARRRRHPPPQMRTATYSTPAPSNVMNVVAARGCAC